MDIKDLQHSIFDHLEELVIYLDPDSRILWANRSALDYFNTTLEDVVGTICFEKWRHLGFCPNCPVQKTKITGEPGRAVSIKPDGHVWSMRSVPELDEDGNIRGLFEIALDITELVNLREEVLVKEQSLTEIVESVDAILWSFSITDDRWEYVSPRTMDILGYKPEEWTNLQFWLDGLHPDDRQWASEYCFTCTQRGEAHTFEYRFRKEDGGFVWLRDKVIVEMNEDQPVRMRGIMIDITDSKKQEEELTYLSFHDQLTGLYNRRMFEEELRRLDSERMVPISIVLADVNGLKMVNDAFGHKAGDELLIKAAQLLKKSFRQEDIIARWGGDEFVILLPRTGQQKTGQIVQRILQRAKKTEKDDIPVSVSFGWSTKESPDDNIQKVLRDAEEWMYKNKLNESSSARSALLRGMLQSLEDKSHETKAHLERMQVLARKLGQQMGLSPSEMNRLTLLVSLHDVGEITVPESIMRKPGPLTRLEWSVIHKHPEMGQRIALATGEFSAVADDILHHHEHWDGDGYPKGVQGEAIPRLARIAAVIDAYDAMMNERPYRVKMTQDEALKELEKEKGHQFDPDVVDAFVEMLKNG